MPSTILQSFLIVIVWGIALGPIILAITSLISLMRIPRKAPPIVEPSHNESWRWSTTLHPEPAGSNETSGTMRERRSDLKAPQYMPPPKNKKVYIFMYMFDFYINERTIIWLYIPGFTVCGLLLLTPFRKLKNITQRLEENVQYYQFSPRFLASSLEVFCIAFGAWRFGGMQQINAWSVPKIIETDARMVPKYINNDWKRGLAAFLGPSGC